MVMRTTADYLKRALVKPRRPYTVAIAAYALALMGNPQQYNPTDYLLRASVAGITETQPCFI